MKSLIVPFVVAVTAATGSLVLSSGAAMAGPTFVGVEGENIAVSGYDVTSYFTGEGAPTKGDKAHSVDYKGAVYYFSSAANAATFKKDPAKFAPQYGGHCAWAVSRGSLAPGNPMNFKLVDGKLYLNFNDNVQKTWLSDIPGFISKAEDKWPSFKDTDQFGG